MSKARERIRRDFAAKAAKIRQEKAQAIGELRSTPDLPKRALDQGIKQVNDAAEQDMTDLRVEFAGAIEAELNAIKQKLYGFDDIERMSTVQQMAWRDAISKAQQVQTEMSSAQSEEERRAALAQAERDAREQLAAAMLAGDKMWVRALNLVGEQRRWGPAIHQAWADVDPEAAALMDEYDELEQEMGNQRTRLEDSAELSLRGKPQFDSDADLSLHGGAPQLAD